MKKPITITLLITLALMPAAHIAQANTIVYGRIYTSDETQPWAEAMAIEDGKFVYVGDAAGVEQPQAGVHYGQSVILNAKTRKVYVKLVNASDEKKTADIDLSRFSIKKNVVKTVLTGKADDENNYEKQPIAPTKETVKAQKKFSLDVEPYTMVMMEYQL